MKNLLKTFLLLLFSIVFINSTAMAFIESEEDLEAETDKVRTLYSTDISSFYNKGEVIGIALANFNVYTSEYKLKIKTIINSLEQIQKNITTIRESEEHFDTDKEAKIQALLKDANSELNNTSTYTINYLNQISIPLPTITYSRFRNKYISYFNSLDINNNYIDK